MISIEYHSSDLTGNDILLTIFNISLSFRYGSKTEERNGERKSAIWNVQKYSQLISPRRIAPNQIVRTIDDYLFTRHLRTPHTHHSRLAVLVAPEAADRRTYPIITHRVRTGTRPNTTTIYRLRGVVPR